MKTETGVDRAKLEDLLGRAQHDIDTGVLPACQLALAKNNEIVCFETFGQATNDTRFAIFSETKAFVCSVVWMLLGQHDLSVEERVADLVPGFGANGKEDITVEHVLSHSAGIPTAFLNPFHWDDVAKRRETFASWQLEWEPGTRFEYHPLAGLWVLCDIIETSTGVRFTQALRERLVEPLGLETFILGGPEAATVSMAPLVIVGEHPSPEEIEAALGVREMPPSQHPMLLALSDPSLRRTGIPGGGGVSTAADVAMFYQALLHNPNGMWDERTLRDATGRIRNAHIDAGRGFPMNYGLGVRIAGDDGYGPLRGLADSPRVFGHDGAGGQIAWADPDTGASFCYLTNGLDDNLTRQGRRVVGVTNRALACAQS